MTSIAVTAATQVTRRHAAPKAGLSYLLGCALFLAGVVGLFGLAGF